MLVIQSGGLEVIEPSSDYQSAIWVSIRQPRRQIINSTWNKGKLCLSMAGASHFHVTAAGDCTKLTETPCPRIGGYWVKRRSALKCVDVAITLFRLGDGYFRLTAEP